MAAWLKKVLRRESAGLFRGRLPAVALLFGIPIAYSLLFGLTYSSNSVKYIPTVVYDQDQSALSRTLVQAFSDSERYDIVAQVATQEEMEEQLRTGSALVAVAIPPRFARDVKTGLASEVLVVTNATNLMFTNTVISSSQEILQTVAAATGRKLFEAAGQPPDQALNSALPVRFNVRLLNNPTLSYSDFVLAGLSANGLQLAIILVTCTLLTKEYSRLERWKDCPAAALVAGKVIPCWLWATAAFAACMAVIAGLFGVPCRGSLLSLLLIGSAFTFAVCAAGLLFSAVAPNEIIAIEAPILYIMPAFLFCGYSWPHFAMNGFARAFSAILPLTYAADTVRDILLAGYAPALLKNTVLLFSFGGVLLAIATLVFSWRRQRAAAPGREASL